eukprot:TRINITY_DN6259_c0_g2_i2.p1 TRINITY_DN6259_c0_g2~~TRINITY_DN6259_c0_g2_i2.p1  ORF type:complete len:223 (+),score=62.75 TRINITY_DN6259_c0_g2_i2:113-781(+)
MEGPCVKLPQSVYVKAPLASYRTPQQEDDEAMKNILSNPNNTKHLPFFTHHWTNEQIVSRRELQIKRQREENSALVIYILAKDKDGKEQVVGTTGFTIMKLPSKEDETGVGFYGIILDQQYCGKKIAIEAELISLTLLFDVLKIKRARASTDQDNQEMKRFFDQGSWVLESIGGDEKLPNAHNYVLSEGDWPPLKQKLRHLLGMSEETNELLSPQVSFSFQW